MKQTANKTEYSAGEYDIAIVGAGHAGVEAAIAAARLGASVILFTLSLDCIANMPCNPSIGGTAKGHLVREIDALGGEMGKAADETFLQSRMLNRGKGPAVHSLRVQSDRAQYHLRMKTALERQQNLDVKQAEIVAIRRRESGLEAVTALGAVFGAKCVILATGTYLKGRVFVGEHAFDSGPDGTHAANRLTESLLDMGIELRRFKTGTPARVHRRSIDFDVLEPQHGDEPVVPFSFEEERTLQNRMICHIAYTNEETHRVIRENIDRSPLYGGMIEGIGPRYCPSIEDKVMRFADKDRHQIFVEPMGLETDEMYLQGLSSSLPEEVQIALYRTIRGFENVKIMRNAYAIEYDCCNPQQLRATLEFKDIPGLYGAGQFNGTSGYEEAAAQGLVAGINAARSVQGKEPLVLERSGSYIGTLIDDLVVKGCQDPYRMMTSRSEYRLYLRQDNADLRLTPTGYEIGLISEARWEKFREKYRQIGEETRRLETTSAAPSEQLNRILTEKGTQPVSTGVRLAELIKRPQIGYADLAAVDPGRPNLPHVVTEQVEIELKYAGYITKQLAQIEKKKKTERRGLPQDIDYRRIRGLRIEAAEKLAAIRPETLGQASRISGVSPADVDVLFIWLESTRRKEGES